MKTILKAVAFNIGVVSIFTALLLVYLPIAQDIRLYFRTRSDKTASVPRYDQRHLLPPYDGEEWAGRLFAESANQRHVYRDFVIWRLKPFSGETITVDRDGIRRHGNAAAPARSAPIWVFGGSTIWGDGAPDNMTIPAYLEQIMGRRTANFGQLAYIAHQGLNALMQENLTGSRPELVVFYDGYNDVAVQCRTDRSIYSSQYEDVLSQLVTMADQDTPRITMVVAPLQKTLLQLFSDGSRPFGYDCHSNSEKAELVAKGLIQDWKIAKSIVEANGGRFLAVLQPSAFVGTPNTGYLKAVTEARDQHAQHQAVYPIIRRELSRSAIEFLDLSAIFDGSERVYVDQAHLAPKGNKKVADAIAAHLAARP